MLDWGANVVCNDPRARSSMIVWGDHAIGTSSGQMIVWGDTGSDKGSTVWKNLVEE